jgi:PBP1b-binding outer membrane lipoprotein LpoB
LKKSVIFVALLSAMFFVSCKNTTDVKPEETTTEATMEEQVDSVATDSIKADEVAPVEIEKDTLTKK